jgi:hypothetical protein
VREMRCGVCSVGRVVVFEVGRGGEMDLVDVSSDAPASVVGGSLAWPALFLFSKLASPAMGEDALLVSSAPSLSLLLSDVPNACPSAASRLCTP